MKSKLIRHAALALAFGLTMITAASATAQTYTFNTSTEGWLVFDIFFLGNQVPNRLSNGASPALDSSVGLPAPSLRVTDLAGATWIGAPASIRGDRSALYGQSISFDIQYRERDEAIYASIGIESLALAIYASEPQPPLNIWLRRDYPLLPGQWRVGNINGDIATEAQIRSVLSNLYGVYIQTEWKTGPDDTSVDNISIGTITPPATCLADVASDSLDTTRNPNGAVGAEDLDAFIAGFIDGNTAIADVASDSLDTTFNPNGSVGAEDLDAFIASFIAGC